MSRRLTWVYTVVFDWCIDLLIFFCECSISDERGRDMVRLVPVLCRGWWAVFPMLIHASHYLITIEKVPTYWLLIGWFLSIDVILQISSLVIGYPCLLLKTYHVIGLAFVPVPHYHPCLQDKLFSLCHRSTWKVVWEPFVGLQRIYLSIYLSI